MEATSYQNLYTSSTGIILSDPLIRISTSRLEGVNIIVEIDEKEYEIEFFEYHYDMIGRIVLLKGDKHYFSKDLKDKLASQ